MLKTFTTTLYNQDYYLTYAPNHPILTNLGFNTCFTLPSSNTLSQNQLFIQSTEGIHPCSDIKAVVKGEGVVGEGVSGKSINSIHILKSGNIITYQSSTPITIKQLKVEKALIPKDMGFVDQFGYVVFGGILFVGVLVFFGMVMYEVFRNKKK